MNNITQAQKIQSVVAPQRKNFQEVQLENQRRVMQWMCEEENEEEEEYRQEDERISFRR